MPTFKEVRKKIIESDLVGGDVIAFINGAHVVIGKFDEGQVKLSEEGKVLFDGGDLPGYEPPTDPLDDVPTL